MAIPAAPSNFAVQQGNQQIYASWALQAGATSYSVQRSTDGVTFAVVSTPTNPEYTDTSVTLGTQYWYQVASVNSSGTSTYTSSQSSVPAPVGEMSLGELRLRSQQRADRVNSPFVSNTEWNFFINQSMMELYDLLIMSYEDYFKAPDACFPTASGQSIYPLPNGTLTFNTSAGVPFVPKALYKLLGVDLGINSANNAYVTVNKYNLIDRNRYVYPNTSSTIYGVFNLQYRMLGNNLEFIPVPTSGQPIRLLYAPRLDTLLKDNDVTTIGFSGWLQYVIIRAAKYALDKEESDTSKLDSELLFLKGRIESAAQGRDAGQPDKISDIRQGGNWGDNGPMNGFKGGW